MTLPKNYSLHCITILLRNTYMSILELECNVSLVSVDYNVHIGSPRFPDLSHLRQYRIVMFSPCSKWCHLGGQGELWTLHGKVLQCTDFHRSPLIVINCLSFPGPHTCILDLLFSVIAGCFRCRISTQPIRRNQCAHVCYRSTVPSLARTINERKWLWRTAALLSSLLTTRSTWTYYPTNWPFLLVRHWIRWKANTTSSDIVQAIVKDGDDARNLISIEWGQFLVVGAMLGLGFGLWLEGGSWR